MKEKKKKCVGAGGKIYVLTNLNNKHIWNFRKFYSLGENIPVFMYNSNAT